MLVSLNASLLVRYPELRGVRYSEVLFVYMTVSCPYAVFCSYLIRIIPRACARGKAIGVCLSVSVCQHKIFQVWRSRRHSEIQVSGRWENVPSLVF